MAIWDTIHSLSVDNGPASSSASPRTDLKDKHHGRLPTNMLLLMTELESEGKTFARKPLITLTGQEGQARTGNDGTGQVLLLGIVTLTGQEDSTRPRTLILISIRAASLCPSGWGVVIHPGACFSAINHLSACSLFFDFSGLQVQVAAALPIYSTWFTPVLGLPSQFNAPLLPLPLPAGGEDHSLLYKSEAGESLMTAIRWGRLGQADHCGLALGCSTPVDVSVIVESGSNAV